MIVSEAIQSKYFTVELGAFRLHMTGFLKLGFVSVLKADN